MTRFAIVSLLALGACKKAGPIEDPMQGLNRDKMGVQDIGLDLQVVALSPGQVSAATVLTARIYGAGFNEAVRVEIGDIELEDVLWQDKNTLNVQVPGMAPGVYDVAAINPDGGRSVLRSGLSVGAEPAQAVDCRNTLVYFALNQAGLTEAAKDLLATQSPCFNSSTAPIDVEGHADERGTTDYNVSLGQRRAKTVVGYLQTQGVSSSRARIVSWGEERPVDRGHDEAAWAKNRRVEVRLQ